MLICRSESFEYAGETTRVRVNSPDRNKAIINPTWTAMFATHTRQKVARFISSIITSKRFFPRFTANYALRVTNDVLPNDCSYIYIYIMFIVDNNISVQSYL